MKKCVLSIIFLFTTVLIISQVPQSFKYQAVLRDSLGNIIADHYVCFRVSILQGNLSGVTIYSEVHNVNTNQYGLVSVEIGKGSFESGVFSGINWTNSPYFIQTELDMNCIHNYILIGKSQLVSVPYSLMSGGLILTDQNGNSYTVGVDTLGNLITSVNSLNNNCGEILIDSRDGNQYRSVPIGDQCWMVDNLAYLPFVNPSSVGSDTIPHYYVYGYNGTDVLAAKATYNYLTYGVLYNWPAVMSSDTTSNAVPSGVQGICPDGWHLPSDEEWKIVEGEIDTQYGYPDPEWDTTGFRGFDVGGNTKQSGYSLWGLPNLGGINLSGFTGLPGGYRLLDGTFDHLGYAAHFWTSYIDNNDKAYLRYLHSNNKTIGRNLDHRSYGFSLRCVKD